jgi:hypothetical protein
VVASFLDAYPGIRVELVLNDRNHHVIEVSTSRSASARSPIRA